MPSPALLLVLALFLPFSTAAIGQQEQRSLYSQLKSITLGLSDTLDPSQQQSIVAQINSLPASSGINEFQDIFVTIGGKIVNEIQALKEARRTNLIEIARQLIELLKQTTSIKTDITPPDMNLTAATATIGATTTITDDLQALTLDLAKNLKNEIDRLATELQRLVTVRNETNTSEVQALKDQLATAQKAITLVADLQRKTTEDKEKITGLQTSLETTNSTLSSLQEQLATTTKDLETARENLAQKEAQISQLQTTQPGAPSTTEPGTSEEIATIKRRNEELSRENDTLTAKQVDAEKAVRTSDAKVQQLQAQLLQCNDDLKTANKQTTSPLSSILMVSATQQQANQKLAESEAKVSQLTGRVKELEQQLENLRSKHTTELAELNQQFSRATQSTTTNVQTQVQQIRDLEAKVAQLSTQLQQRTTELQAAKQSVAQTAQLAVLQMGVQSKLNENTTTIDDLKKQIKSYKEDEAVWLKIETDLIPIFTAQVADLKNMINEETYLNQQEAEKMFSSNLANFKKQFTNLKNILADRIDLINQAHAAVKELADATAAAQLLKQQITTLKDVVSRLPTASSPSISS